MDFILGIIVGYCLTSIAWMLALKFIPNAVLNPIGIKVVKKNG